MFNLGGFATLLHALAITNILISPVAVSASSADRSIHARAAAIVKRTLSIRDNNSLASRADCSHPPSYNAPPITDQEFAPYNEAEATYYRYRQQQSVNLGSWFLHEKWMTPSVFECAAGHKGGEIDIAHGWGGVNGARAVLEKHWDTFIKEDDLKYLQSIGINTVRLPIGYFNLGPEFTKGTPFDGVGEVYKNAWPRIVRTINQAAKYNIGVLVDMHGAVGSQNGNDHSGVSDGKTQLFHNKGFQDKTIDALVFLMKKLVKVNNVVGIQILNEPKNVNELIPFYNRAIDAMRATSEEAKAFPLYIHDGFDLRKFSNYVAGRKDFVVQDNHSYFVFSASDKAKSADQHIQDVKHGVKGSLSSASQKQGRNLVIDEWSCALNGGASREVSKDFCTSQMKTYTQATAGWSFWSYNKENCEHDAGWCFKSAVGKNLPKTFFSYPDSNGKVPQGIATAPTASSSTSSPSSTSASTSTSSGNAAATTTASSAEASGTASATISPAAPAATGKCKTSKARSLKKLQKRSKHVPVVHIKRDDAQEANQRGYKDGVRAAKDFAAFDLSKLGFTWQFINDNVAKLGSGVVKSANIDDYADGFFKGLRDGEAEVQKLL